jgi:AcrR family transcriptional regulator
MKEMASVRVNGERTNRGLRSRAALVAAARTIFERDGFRNARITDISKLAGMAHGSFYTYFSSKEEIFQEVIKDLLVELMGAGSPAAENGDGVVARIERANRLYLEAYQRHARLLRTWDEVATFNGDLAALLRLGQLQFVSRAERTLQKLQREGRLDPEIDPHYAATALTSMVGGFARTWFITGEEFELDNAVIQLTRLWANAVGLDESKSGQ